MQAGVQAQHNTHMPIDIATKRLARLHKLTAYVEDLKHKMAAAHKAAQEFKKDYHAAVQRCYNVGRIDPGYVVAHHLYNNFFKSKQNCKKMSLITTKIIE
eukprot:m51a1_g1528 hypothetical protein (100) ;mRNA; f:495520-498011